MKSKRTPPSACCPPRQKAVVASQEHVEALKALAHLGRLSVFFEIVHAGRPVPANEVQGALKLPAPTLSHHLNELERAGLIERERRERYVLSTVRREMVVELVRILTACC
jgi:DNA-binding transcriptional ArsR family regulator